MRASACSCRPGTSGRRADRATGKGTDQTEERIDQERREALTRLAKYTAPAMLALLLSVDQAGAQICIPTSIVHCPV
jgi:hypothetical protein